MINVANLSERFPIWVEEKEYEELKRRNAKGWQDCRTEKEWLVKLHYLRKGFKEKKIDAEKFFKLERELVLRWWIKWC